MIELILGAIDVSQGEGITGILGYNENLYATTEERLINVLRVVSPEIVKKYRGE